MGNHGKGTPTDSLEGIMNSVTEQKVIHLKPLELLDFTAKMVQNRLPFMVTGAPGVGKTEIITEGTALAGADFLISHPAIEDPTVPGGFPWPDPNGKEARFLPFGILAQAIRATKPTAWLLDDFGQANPSVQAAYMQLIRSGRVGEHVLPNYVTFILATNRRTDRAGVTGVLEPVKGRMASIVELQTSIDDWCQWAFAHGIPATLVAFLRFKPSLLSAFMPTADLTNSPTPRTWASLAALEKLGFARSVEHAAFAGAVGQAAADEYLVFRQLFKSMVNLDSILADPDHAPIPTKLDELYATSVGLASRANETNFNRIATYATRLAVEANRGEFAVLLARDSERNNKKVVYTDAYVKLHSGPIGKLFSGN